MGDQVLEHQTTPPDHSDVAQQQNESRRYAIIAWRVQTWHKCLRGRYQHLNVHIAYREKTAESPTPFQCRWQKVNAGPKQTFPSTWRPDRNSQTTVPRARGIVVLRM